MNTLGERFKYRRESLGLTQDDVAKQVQKLLPGDRFNRVTVSNIELGNQASMKDRVLLAVLKVLKCTGDWLINGRGPIELIESGNVEPGPEVQQKCPVINWVQAGAWTAVEDSISLTDAEYYPCPVRCGPRTFILRVRGESMMNKFEDGDMIYVDPDQVEAIHGKYVVAMLDDANEATFKQLQILDEKKFLKALNPDYPPELRFVPINGNCRIVGTVVSHVKPV